MRIIFFYLIFPLFLLSCSAIKRTSIDVLMAPDFSLPVNVENLIVLNNSSYFSVDSSANKVMNSLKDNEVFIIDTIAIINLFEGFFSVIDESPVDYLSSAGYTEIRRMNGNMIPEPLAEEEVVFFCRENETDAIISLEFFDLDLDYKQENTFNFSSGNIVNAYLSINRKTLWRIYDSTGFILDEYLQNDTLFWSNSDYYAQDAYNGLPLATEAIRSAFFSLGQDYGKRISPYWYSVFRAYYPIKDKGRVDYSLDRNYLLKLSEHKNKIKSYKACFNLSFLSEREDDLRSSLRWLEIAEFKNPASPYAGKYRKLIEERITSREKMK